MIAQLAWVVTPYLVLALAYAGFRLYRDVKKGDKQ